LISGSINLVDFHLFSHKYYKHETRKILVCHEDDYRAHVSPYAHTEIVNGRKVRKIGDWRIEVYKNEEEYKWYRITL